MTLAEMAVSYRRQADILRHRIQLVEELPAWNQEEVIAKLKSFNREKSIKRAESREKMLSKI